MKHETAQPMPLGAIHGRVGAIDKQLRILAVVGINADADAGRQPQHVIAHAAGSADRGDDLAGDMGRIRCLRYLGKQDQELVAAMAADRVRFAHRRHQAKRHQLQHLISGRMAQGVVDFLEMVDVQEQQCQAGSMAPGDGDGLGETVEQQQAVGQRGQHIEPYRAGDFVQHLCAGFRIGLGAQHRQNQMFIGLDQPG